MPNYRLMQLQAAALIESGSYTAEQIAEIYGWTKSRAAPERSKPQHTKPKRKRKRKLLRIIRRLLE